MGICGSKSEVKEGEKVDPNVAKAERQLNQSVEKKLFKVCSDSVTH